MPNRDIIVIGSSHGGTESLIRIVEKLSPELPASVFVVRHLPTDGRNYLVDILARRTSLSVVSAGHCKEIRQKTIHIAPANYHLIIDSAHTYLSKGPRENLCRPAIDPLFRSAAAAYGPRVIGIVLSGELDDGTAGLDAIKQCGGMAIIEDPATAVAPSMPESAARNVAIDYTLSAADISILLNGLVKEAVPSNFQCPEEITMELSLLAAIDSGIDALAGNAIVPVSCPDCGGPLWEIKGRLPRFRCHIGHAFSGQSMFQALRSVEEKALLAALRALDERVRMLRRLGRELGGLDFEERLREAETQAQQLRNLLSFTEGKWWEC